MSSRVAAATWDKGADLARVPCLCVGGARGVAGVALRGYMVRAVLSLFDNGFLRRCLRCRLPIAPVREKKVAPCGVGGSGAKLTRRDGGGLPAGDGGAGGGVLTLRGGSGVTLRGGSGRGGVGSSGGVGESAIGAGGFGSASGTGVAMDVRMLVSSWRAAV